MNLLHDFLLVIGGLLAGLIFMWVFMTRGLRSVPIDPVTHRVLNILARKTGRTAKDLLREALRDLYFKYRKREESWLPPFPSDPEP